MRDIPCGKFPLEDIGCHMFVGFLISLIVGVLFNPYIGVVVGLVVGLTKELYDQYSYSGGDFYDFFATGIGAIIGFIASSMIFLRILTHGI